MKNINLTKGLIAIVDDEDYEWLLYHKWHACKTTYGGFIAVNGQRVFMHRLILDIWDSKIDVDHINHNTLDNRRSNIRLASRFQNNGNSFKRNGVTSVFKGVYFHSKNRKWIANIMIDRKQYYIGSFVSEVEAANAYDEAAINIFGDFALINKKG